MAISNRGLDNYGRLDRTFATQHSTIPIVSFFTFGDPRSWTDSVGEAHRATTSAQPVSRELRPRTIHGFDGHDAIRTGVSMVQVQKQLGAPSGSWVIQLIGKVEEFDAWQPNVWAVGKDWSEVLSDGDWCVIRAVKDGNYSTLAVGRIDTISVAITANSTGAVTVRTTVSGRDVGAPYEDVPVYFNPYDDVHNNAFGHNVAKMLDGSTVLDGSPSVIAKQVLHLFTDGGSYGQKPDIPAGVFSNEIVNFDDVIDTSTVGDTKGTVYAASVLKVSSAGSVWDYASQFVVPQFNEMFVDIDPNELYGDFESELLSDANMAPMKKVYLTIRERPFVNTTDGTNSPWFQLTPIHLHLSEVQSINLSKGRNRINQIQLLTNTLSGMQASVISLFPPIHDINSAKRFGLRRMEQKTNHDFGVGMDTAKLRNLLMNWNVLNPYYYSGMITMPSLMPNLRIGKKVVLKGGPTPAHSIVPSDEDVPAPLVPSKDCGGAMTFYIEGVQYMFQAGGETPTVSTQIMVSRGYPENRRLSDISELSKHWAASDTVDPEKGDAATEPPTQNEEETP